MDRALFFWYVIRMRKKRSSTIWIFVILVVFLLLNIFTPLSKTIESTLLTAFSPIQSKFLSAGNNFFNNLEVFQNAKEVRDEIERLRKENRKFLVEVSSLKEIEKENIALREALGVPLFEETSFILSRVSGRDLLGHEIIVNHDGEAKKGSPVVTPEGVLVGKVLETGEGFSRVEMLTNKNSAIEVKVQSEETQVGLIKGIGEAKLLLDFLAKEKAVDRGDLVISLPYNKKADGGIFIGRILEAKKSDVEAFSQAYVWQGVDYRYIDHLFIMEK